MGVNFGDWWLRKNQLIDHTLDYLGKHNGSKINQCKKTAEIKSHREVTFEFEQYRMVKNLSVEVIYWTNKMNAT